MSKAPRTTALGLVLFVAGVLLPVSMAAEMGAPELRASLQIGFWLTKAALAASGLLTLLGARVYGGGTPDRETAEGSTASPPWQILALLAAGLLLRLPALGEGLWFDEIQTQLTYVRLPWGRLLTTFDSTNQHLLFSASAHLVQQLVGESAWSLRLPAVFFGTASLWACLALGRRWLSSSEAWWAVALLTVSYHHVWFSQNARGYTGQLLGTLWSTALFLDLVRPRTRSTLPDVRLLVQYALAVSVLMWSHLTGAVVVAAHGLVWLWRARSLAAGRARWAPLLALCLGGAFVSVGYAHLIPQALAAVGGSGKSAVAIEWQNPAWFLGELVRSLASALPGGMAVVAVAALAGAQGIWFAWRRDAVATALLVLPLGVMLLVVLSTGHNIWPRFFFFGAGFLVQLAVRGGFGFLDRLGAWWSRRRATPRSFSTLGHASLAVVLLGSVLILPRAWAPKQDYAAAVAWIDAHRGPDDAVIVTDLTAYPVQDWLGKTWPRADDAAQLIAAESPVHDSWVLYTFPIRLRATFPEVWARLQTAYTPQITIPGTVGDGAIVIMRRTPGGRTAAPRQ